MKSFKDCKSLPIAVINPLTSEFVSHINGEALQCEQNLYKGYKIIDFLGYEQWQHIKALSKIHQSFTMETIENNPMGIFAITSEWSSNLDGTLTSKVLSVKSLKAVPSEDEKIASCLRWLTDTVGSEGSVDLNERLLSITFDKDSGIIRRKALEIMGRGVTLLFTLRGFVDKISVNTPQKTFVFPSTTPKKCMPTVQELNLSEFISRNPHIPFTYRDATITVMSGSKAEDYKYLFYSAWLGEKQLNRPLNELIGNPIDTVEASIANPRLKALEETLKIGFCEYGYTHHWKGYEWFFECRMVKVDNGKEILLVSYYPESKKIEQETRFRTLVNMG